MKPPARSCALILTDELQFLIVIILDSLVTPTYPPACYVDTIVALQLQLLIVRTEF